MKAIIEQIDTLLDCVNDLQEQGCHGEAYKVALMAQEKLNKILNDLAIRLDPSELP